MEDRGEGIVGMKTDEGKIISFLIIGCDLGYCYWGIPILLVSLPFVVKQVGLYLFLLQKNFHYI